ncbi:BtuE Glutathione peroxidase [uncultured Caudovirales phage]|uniref:BtuE Glutathione peroxidase n=1 Tax=uncultured Caudovirales phage TaxID=2100421 RepID=A0A6J5QAZ5_9CAUD|nr:BtuE Glutathione peroxidase [uncultured Caudovirales phage]CAB4156816.1 BtuE Glutathione peroxidase [uncultured Caudovirales phage]CAB4160113.1 BtuE Glutathione peroxidase [uncultured Caudovirales phage]CAB4164368.1 BtuE Glutathione peroxidase [uncultured Caudovirales phage]CAB4172231.1 BtuE Glutathione peroxidase [uncultured Caudovirales phage]
MNSAFDIKIASADGLTDDVLSTIRGRTCMIVNIATKAKYEPKTSAIWSYARTARQLWELQTVHDMYENFSVVGVPCNQFGSQDPATNKEIASFVKKAYPWVTFPITEKVEVNGENEHPLFSFLKGTAKRVASDTRADNSAEASHGHNVANQALHRVPHNYEKFILDTSGRVIRRFSWGEFPLALERLTDQSSGTILEALKEIFGE